MKQTGKRLAAIFLICVVVATIFAGCSGGLGEKDLLSIRNRSNGRIISIGDKRADVEKVTGGDEANITDFLEDGVQRVDYWDTPGVYVDYLDDTVVAIRLFEGNRWEIAGKVRIGMAESDVKDLHKDNKMMEEGLQGGVLLSYDENLEPIAFSQESPYLIVISFEEGVVSEITIQSNHF